MKKLLLLFSLIIILSSCDDSVMITKNNEALTTVEMLKNVDTTLQVSILKNEVIYAIKDNVVIAKGSQDITKELITAIFCLSIGFALGAVITITIIE
jgi:hypothetical protein